MDVEEVRRRRSYVPERELAQAVYRLTPAGTSEVAELVGLSRQATSERLERIESKGWIWSKKVGPTRVWMHKYVMREPGELASEQPAPIPAPDAELPDQHPNSTARRRAASSQGKEDRLSRELTQQRDEEREREIEKSREHRRSRQQDD